jgi:diguanylate cyclase (GGDEF)-like protein
VHEVHHWYVGNVVVRFAAFLLLGLFAIGGSPVEAASVWENLAGPVFVHTDTRELPEAAVMSLAQDRAGFLWVGTQGGLARFDGYHFRSFLPNPSDPKALPDGYVRTILPDADGGLWIGSSSNGLAHFDAGTATFRTWRPDRSGRSGPRSASVDALVVDGGALWIGGDGGLGRFDLQTRSFVLVAFNDRGEQPVVWSLLVDRKGTLWAGTQNGLFYRTAGSGRFVEFRLRAGARVTKPVIYSLCEDRDGRLWAGSVSALYVLDPQRRNAHVLRTSAQNIASLAPGQQWALMEVTPGVLWAGTDSAISIVGTASGSVRRVDTDLKNPGGLTGGRVVGFLRDRSGLIWLANHVGGLLSYNPFSHGLYQISATRAAIGFANEGAPAVAAIPGDRLWVGGFLGRLTEFEPKISRSTTLAVPNRAAIQTLLPERDGSLWIGTTGGLCRLASGATAATCPARPAQLASPSVYALLEDGRRLWVGGSSGLLADDMATGKVTPYPRGTTKPLSNNQVRVLYRDRRGRLWIGTENGLNRLDADGKLERFVFTPGNGDGIGPGGITSILEDRRGRIWAGANGGPLELLEENRNGVTHFRRIGLADGMPHENVDGLAEDSRGRIWASTDKGIALIDPDTLHARGLGLADGVSEGAFWAGTVSQSADGTIFFGGLDGITVVGTGAASAWNYSPPLVVSALELDRRDIPAAAVNRGDATVELAADARDISVEFSSLDYSAPQALRYAYKLDGYDRDWINTDAQHRLASYTHLSPGDYTLEVRGSNRLGVWSSHVLRLNVHALPAWYETWWLSALAAAVLLLVAYGVHRLRTAVLLRRQRVLEVIVDERTRELSEANAKLLELSLSDPLTGLRNRRFLAQHLEADIARTLRRYDDWRAGPMSDAPKDADVLFFLIDLDHFKTVNDRFGHHAGDLVLTQMRERLQEVFRESDFVVRWGGDEFLTVARDSRRSEAGVFAERIRDAVASRPFALGAEQSTNMSVSVGFAAFPFVPTAPDAVSWSHVVGLADHALYMAKEAGRNTWFGLAATGGTDPAALTRLDQPAEELVRTGALDVVTRSTTGKA